MKRESIVIDTVDDVKEWTKDGNTIYFHNLTMRNFDKINIGKKKRLKPNELLSYEIIGDKKEDGTYQQEYPKAKSYNPNWENKKSGFDTKGVEVGHALNNAVNMICAGVELSCDPGNSNEEKIYNYAKVILALSKRLKNEHD